MQRIVVDLTSGETHVVELTADEEAAAQARAVAEAAARHPDVVAPQRVDAIDRLQFEVMFDIENRMRAREGQGAVTRAQYRNALIARWKALNSA